MCFRCAVEAYWPNVITRCRTTRVKRSDPIDALALASAFAFGVRMNSPVLPTVVGVDGAKSGWIAVWSDSSSAEGVSKLDFFVYPSAVALCAAHKFASVIAVDIPIGLAQSGPRAPDSLARKVVGGKRACTIFSAPIRPVLNATSRQEASDLHSEIDGRRVSAQTFAIMSKILEWDLLLRDDVDLRSIVREVHPEVSFAALSDGFGLPARKKSREGAKLRRDLLSTTFGDGAVETLLARVPSRAAALDDVLDALVALWSARRIADGTSRALPDPPALDAAGLLMAIHY